jgi:hypothetical protein
VNRRLTSLAALLAVAALSSAPAHAATKKKAKPKPIHGSYTVTLLPDPTPNATNLAGMPGCTGVSPAAVDNHAFKVPAAGTLNVVLDSADPTGTSNTDWDLYLIDTDGSVLDGSHGGTSHEEVTDKFKKGQPLTIQVCNLIGQPSGTVTYTFTYA